ncbi:hypothetical protein [Gimesia chilikensis]|uniref:hypothetical protein n=1 Tax=Gimesia chilikensis TaxID=2605989 RepID=UPI003A8EFD65
MPDESNRDLHTQDNATVDWGLIVVLTLGLIPLLTPLIAILYVGIYWAAVVAVVVFLIWCFVMPTTCINGGLNFSILAMSLLFNTAIIITTAAVTLLISLFS